MPPSRGNERWAVIPDLNDWVTASAYAIVVKDAESEVANEEIECGGRPISPQGDLRSLIARV